MGHRILILTVFSALLLAMAVPAAFAQTGTVQGTVLLPDGQAAAGATVSLHSWWHDPDTLTATTDAAGFFSFNDVMIGMYSATAYLEGYAPGGDPNVMVFADDVVELVLNLHSLDEIGMVTGVVLLADGGAAANATVMLDGGGGFFGHHHFETTTDIAGSFTFDEVPEGTYNIAAHLMGEGFDADVIEVFGNQTTNVVLELHHGGDHDRPDSIIIETHTGIAVVDTINEWGILLVRYGLDVEGDGEVDYHLEFGPPDYDPDGPGGAERPQNGAEITITGVLLPPQPFGPPGLFVLEINGLFWHEPPDDHHGGGWHEGDTLVVVDLAGTAIVEAANPPQRPFARYFIDVDGDAEADYRLCFGPPWYDPDGEGGAERPEDGAEITIHGGLFSYGDREMVIVYDINGMFWREPRNGHGGLIGGDHEADGCLGTSLTRIEFSATAMVQMGNGFHGETHVYAADVDDDNEPDFLLDFGATAYDPDNGSQRAHNGQNITVVGGIMSCGDQGMGIVIVYEMNADFWREPGDTTGLGASSTDADDAPEFVPVTHLVATNYPNPFNPSTTINYSIPATGNVSLKVYDITGREVATLINEFQNAGSYAVEWNAADMPSGIYFYRLSAANQTFTNRMVLVK
jgi:hypothetical protein